MSSAFRGGQVWVGGQSGFPRKDPPRDTRRTHGTSTENPFFGPKIIMGVSYARAPKLMNVPYGAKTTDDWDPVGFSYDTFPPNHMEMPRPALARNSAADPIVVYGRLPNYHR